MIYTITVDGGRYVFNKIDDSIDKARAYARKAFPQYHTDVRRVIRFDACEKCDCRPCCCKC